jgi:multiple sugar transport system permease protein
MVRSGNYTNTVFEFLRNGFLIAVMVFVLFPLVWALLTSVKPEEDIVTAEMQYLPQRLTFDNYVAIWTRSNYPTLVRNSVITTITTLLLTLTVGSLTAYSISRYSFRGRSGLLLFFLVLRMFPAVLLLIPLFILMKNLRLLDSSIGLGLAYTAFLLPVATWLMKGFFDAIPPELEDAARIDGCTRLEALFRVVLPLARSGLVATAVFIGIAAWNDYLLALLLTTSQGSRTWPVGLQLMVGEFQLPWGALSAGGIISIIPVVLLFALVQRTLVRGITAGAIKG